MKEENKKELLKSLEDLNKIICDHSSGDDGKMKGMDEAVLLIFAAMHTSVVSSIVEDPDGNFDFEKGKNYAQELVWKDMPKSIAKQFEDAAK